MNRVKVAIADDHKIYREGIKLSLSSDEKIEVMFEVENGTELLDNLRTQQPDVVIMDYKMPLLDGLEATKFIRENYPAVRVLIITMYADEKIISHLMDNGANGYLLKNSEPEEIIKAIYSIYAYGFYENDIVSKARLKK